MCEGRGLEYGKTVGVRVGKERTRKEVENSFFYIICASSVTLLLSSVKFCWLTTTLCWLDNRSGLSYIMFWKFYGETRESVRERER